MEIPAELKQQVMEMMTGRVEREDKAINELLPRLQHVAKWIEDHCQGDAMTGDRQFRQDLESNGIVPEIVLSAMEKQSDDDIINDWPTEIDTEVAEG